MKKIEKKIWQYINMGVYFYSHYERHWALKKIFLKKLLKNPWQVQKIVVHYKSRYK